MSIPKEFIQVLDTHLELAGKLLDQASVLKDQVNRFERCKAESDFKHKMAMYELRERYANAMMALTQSYSNNPNMAGRPLTVGAMPIPDTDKTMSVRHTPIEWFHIWLNVYLKVTKYRKCLLMQYSYGRNPSFISATPVVVVNKD